MQVVHRVQSHDSVTSELDEKYGEYIILRNAPY